MTNISNILDSEVRARALVRIGYFDDTKKRGRQVDYRRLLGWFVDFSRKDLAKMSPAEQFSLREEIRALQEEGLNFTVNDASVITHWIQTQEAVAHYLKTLTETGQFYSEPFQLKFSFTIPQFLPEGAAQLKERIYFGEFVEPFDGKGLLYLLTLALRHAGDRLRYCKHCSTLFVQARRKQRFCKRECQQVASMRALRMIEREARKTKRRSSQANRRASHGKKRR
ncbi:MAG: hypothetical protein HOP22_03380 [Nitrospiraceae bacterium]|nr:hypothetical protein [Nitrospiraceae bacterium]